MKLVAAVLCLLAIAGACPAQTFTVDGVSNCPDFTEGVTMHLEKGTYSIEFVSGAWSPITDDAIWGGYAWASRLNLYVYATGQSGAIGSPAIPGFYQSPAEAEAAAAAQGLFVLIIPANTIVTFWIPEFVNPLNGCEDNRGSVTFRFVAPLAVKPTTWGAVKALYQ